MSDFEHTDAPVRRRRRRDETLPSVATPEVESGVEPGRELERIGGPDAAILEGRSFVRPVEEFPFWDQVFADVRAEFVRASQTFEGGSTALKREDNYFRLVNDLVSKNPQWGIAPISLSRLVTLLRTYQFGYGALQVYMEMDGLEELYFNKFDQGFYIVRGQKHHVSEHVFRSNAELMQFIQGIARANELEINLSRPALDASLSDGSRMNATIEPMAVDGPNFNIRKHNDIPFTVADLVASGTFTAEFAAELNQWVRAGMNIVVSGGTSSGKTALLNTIGKECIPKEDRVIILENRKELQIYTDDTIYLQTREDATREGGNDITMDALIRQCLRKSPDRIIVGEVRGKEAYYAIAAWGTGHDGSLCTVHANSAPAAITRLEMLARGARELDQEGIRGLLADTIDIIIQVSRYRGKSARRVVEVIQVLHPYKWDQHDAALRERMAHLQDSGQLRAIRDEVQVLTLYRISKAGELVRHNDPVQVEGKTL